MFIERPNSFCTCCGREKLLANLVHTRLFGYQCVCGNQDRKDKQEEIELCDYGLSFSKSG